MLLLLCGLSSGQGTWTQKTSLPSAARITSVAFTIGNKGYFTTGQGVSTSTDYYDDLWEYNPQADTWTQKANFPGGGRGYGIGFAINGKGYFGCGRDVNNLWYNDFWEWDTLTNIWSPKANVGGAARAAATAFVLNGKGYVGTGESSSNYLNDIWEYNPTNDSWTQKNLFAGSARQDVDRAVFTVGNKAYLGLGIGIGNYADFWEYDPNLDFWTQKANFPGGPVFGATGFSINAIGFIGLGTNFGDSTLWEYNTSTNNWSGTIQFPGGPRCDLPSFVINGKAYIGTGWNTQVYYNDLWEYNPYASGINEIYNNNSITIFPNPFSTQTTLQTTTSCKNTTLTVYNSLGQQVKQLTNITGKSITLHRDNLPSGLYFIRLTQENKTLATDKLIITDN
ncbi:MAG: T9SS type A sorting domain-containing protein [Bacteroidetes bacterium]|nr:T9SS type A sorting domain-containing protein [Bacteroidota bacterium]